MDPERTFLRVHARASGMLSQLLTPRIRLAMEYLYLAVAAALFLLLVVMHTNFVQQPGCSEELSGIEFTEAQLVQIKIINAGIWTQSLNDQEIVDFLKQGSSTENSKVPSPNREKTTTLTSRFWSYLISPGEKSKLFFEHWKSNKEVVEPQTQDVVQDSILKDISEEADVQAPKVHWLDKRSNDFEISYLYTVEKGFFMLPEAARSKHNIHTANITISAQNSCFGNRWQRLLINTFVGYDTILINSLMSSPGQGYLYNYQTKELFDLSYGHEGSEGPARFGDYFVTKCGVLTMSLFVFFTTTMSVSFTLRETQARMLKFTVQLQHHARHQLPTFHLIFVHVIESLVFVPIMIGILFFLFEFYDDQLLAFLVLILVWLCELFTMMSVRTSISMQFFPRFFLLYFLVFHIYFFTYPYGFTYLAFAATSACMQHLLLYFWNRFEVPALQRFLRSRGLLHPQANVEVTASAIYTSTVHIARVNLQNSNTVNNSDPIVQNSAAAAGPTSLNPFTSFLLWILGGASSASAAVSIFSMLRDVLDHGQAYGEPQQRVNESLLDNRSELPEQIPDQ